MPTLTICSPSMKQFCATLPTVWRRYMSSVVQLVVLHRGSTPAVAWRAVLSVATVAHAAPTIAVAGSTQLAVVFGSIGLRKRRTGWIGWHNRVAYHHMQLWRSLSTRLGRDRETSGTTGHTADGFAEFSAVKLKRCMSATAGQPTPTVVDSAPSSLSFFRLCSETEVRRIITVFATKSVRVGSDTDVSASRIRRCAAVVYHVHIANASLSQGRLPESQKHAVVSPRLKKRGLDTSNMANYRPVYNLTFVSKLVERVATPKQHNEYLTTNDLLPRFQSAFRKQHSTETAMLRVLSTQHGLSLHQYADD